MQKFSPRLLGVYIVLLMVLGVASAALGAGMFRQVAGGALFGAGIGGAAFGFYLYKDKNTTQWIIGTSTLGLLLITGWSATITRSQPKPRTAVQSEDGKAHAKPAPNTPVVPRGSQYQDTPQPTELLAGSTARPLDAPRYRFPWPPPPSQPSPEPSRSEGDDIAKDEAVFSQAAPALLQVRLINKCKETVRVDYNRDFIETSEYDAATVFLLPGEETLIPDIGVAGETLYWRVWTMGQVQYDKLGPAWKDEARDSTQGGVQTYQVSCPVPEPVAEPPVSAPGPSRELPSTDALPGPRGSHTPIRETETAATGEPPTLDAPSVSVPAAAPPPPPPSSSDSVFTPPKKIYSVEPRYPPLALRRKVEGTVHIKFVIDTEGRVLRPTIVRDQPLGLGKAALDAVRQWRYSPATLDDQPIDFPHSVAVRFAAGTIAGD